MHKHFLFFLLLGSLLLTGCGNHKRGEASLKDATAADSMMYYFGEMNANNYWQDAETDTTLRSQAARDAFVKGLRAAFSLDEDNSAYNKGLQTGIRLALRLREFSTRYGVDLSEDVLAESMAYFLSSDSLIHIGEAQAEFYKIKDRFEQTAAINEATAARRNLAKRGESMGYEMVNDTLYALDVTPAAKTRKFKEGDRLAVEVTASTIDGKEIVTRQFPDSLTLGEGRVPPVVREAIYTMTNGQTRRFMTTPRTIFGRRYQVYNLPYDEPVIFTVKAIAHEKK